MSLKSDIHTAKAIALRYLSRAPRSIKEVELKLKENGIAEDVRKETIHYLIERGYLNDEVFARELAHSRTKSRLWGRNRITHELRQKGVSDEIVKQVVDSHDGDETEFTAAKRALEKWFKTKNKSQKSEVGGQKSKMISPPNNKMSQRAFRHLQAKGFSTSTITAVIQEYLGELDIDEGS